MLRFRPSMKMKRILFSTPDFPAHAYHIEEKRRVAKNRFKAAG